MGDASGTSAADSGTGTTHTLNKASGYGSFGYTGIPGSTDTCWWESGTSGWWDDSASTSDTLPLTVECWVSTKVATSTSYFFGLQYSAVQTAMWSMNSSGVATFTSKNDGTLSTGVTINDGKWHHLCATITVGGALILYVDGTSVYTGTYSHSGSTYDWSIGTSAANAYLGFIAHCASYNAVLTPTQVSNHATAGGANTAITSNYDAVVGSDQPYHWWKCGDTADPLTDIGSTNTKNLSYVWGTVTYSQPGIAGSSVNAVKGVDNGTQNFWEYTGSGTESDQSTFSMECWIKSTSTSGASQYAYFMGQYVSGTLGGSFYIDASGHLAIVLSSSSPTRYSTSAVINDGNWHYIACTATGGTLTLYVDGSSVGSTPYTATGSSMYWALGTSSSYPGYPHSFAGTITQAATYQVALSATRITAHYNAGLGVVTVNGTASLPLGPLTLTATGTVSGIVNGIASLPLGPLSLSATGAVLSVPIILLGPITLTAAGTPSGSRPTFGRATSVTRLAIFSSNQGQ
jgi:concanavalin A-like lectin/glucanase superfamily protein